MVRMNFEDDDYDIMGGQSIRSVTNTTCNNLCMGSGTNDQLFYNNYVYFVSGKPERLNPSNIYLNQSERN
jgi:hypothetical protein